MKQKYKNITTILENFCSSYKDLKELSNDLTKALRGTIQPVSDDIATDIAASIVNDRKYVSTLANAIRSRDPLSAMRIYASCIDELDGFIETRKATVQKLQERIMLQEDGSPEVSIAIKKRAQYNSEIEVLKERMAFCMTRFYCLRQSIIRRICQYSDQISKSISDESVKSAKPIALKFKVPINSLCTVDGRISGVNK